MTALEPLPGTYGKADWVDYSNYWREADAEWMQDRMVLRVLNATGRDALAQSTGSLVYNEALDQVELRSKAGGYKTLTPLPTSLATAEAAGKTTISHTGAGGLGLTFTAAEVGVNDDFNVLGVLMVSPTGVSLKTGAKTAKLTTDAANLVSDSPISAPGVAITAGSLSAAGRPAQVGALTADSAAVSGVLTAGANSAIAGVAFRAGGYTEAAQGYVSSGGYFNGDSGSALMRYRNPANGAIGSSYLQATQTDVVFAGGNCWMNPTLLIRGGKAINYYDGAGNFRGYIAPSVYSASDPGAGNFPDGTIWVS